MTLVQNATNTNYHTSESKVTNETGRLPPGAWETPRPFAKLRPSARTCPLRRALPPPRPCRPRGDPARGQPRAAARRTPIPASVRRTLGSRPSIAARPRLLSVSRSHVASRNRRVAAAVGDLKPASGVPLLSGTIVLPAKVALGRLGGKETAAVSRRRVTRAHLDPPRPGAGSPAGASRGGEVMTVFTSGRHTASSFPGWGMGGFGELSCPC